MPETTPATPETTPTTPETTPTTLEITSTTPETTPTVPEITPTTPKTTSTTPETTSTTPETTPTTPKTASRTPETTPTTPETTPPTPETTPTTPETTPTMPETTPTTPETTPTTPETTSRTPEITSRTPETTPTTPEITSTMPETTPKTPEITSTTPETTSTTPETTSTIPETTPRMPETTSRTPETTSTMPKIISMTPETTSTTPETTSTMPETTPTMPEITPMTPETTPTTPETTSRMPETTSTMPETTPIIPDAMPTTPETTPTMMLETTPTTPKVTSMTSKTTPTTPSETTSMKSETSPAILEPKHTTRKAMTTISKTTPTTLETMPTSETMTTTWETTYTTPKATPTMPETTPMVAEATPTTLETMPTTSETTPTTLATTLATPEATPTTPMTPQASETTPTASKATPMTSETTPTMPKATRATMPQTTPATPKATPTIPETTPRISGPTQATPEAMPTTVVTVAFTDRPTPRDSAPPFLSTPGLRASTNTTSTITPGSSVTADLSIPRPTTETRPAGPVPSTSQDVPEVVTPRAASTQADTSTAVPRLTDSPDAAGATDSLLSHSGPQTSYSTAIPTVPSAGSSRITLVDPGAETHPDSPTVMVSSAGSGTVVTNLAETPTPSSPTTSTFTHDELDTTTFAMDTSPEMNASSAIPTSVTISPTTPEFITSVLTSFETGTRMMSSTATPASGATELGIQTAVASSNPTISPSVVALVTHPEPEMDTTTARTLTALATLSGTHTRQSPTWIVSPGPPETTDSQVTSHPGSQASSALPAVTRESQSTTAFITLPAQPSPAVATTSPSFPHKESLPSKGVSEEARSVPVTRILLGEHHTGTSLETISTGSPVTAFSPITHTVGQASTAIPTLTVSPEALEMVTSAISVSKDVTHLDSETSSAVPTVTVTSAMPDTAISLVTHSTETNSSALRTSPSLSHSETDTSPLTATVHGKEASSSVPTTAHSSSAADTEIMSQVYVSGTDTPTTKSPLTFSPLESETTSLVTQTTSVIPTLTFFPPSVTEKMTSVVPGPGAEMSTLTPTPTVSPHQSETTAFWVITHPRSQASSPAPTQSVPPERTNGWATHPTETSTIISRTTPDFSHSVSDTLPLVTTGPGVDTSSNVSPKVLGEVTLLITSSSAVTSTSTSSLTLSSTVTETTASSATPTEAQTSATIPAMTASSVLGTVTSLVPSSGSKITVTMSPDYSQEPMSTTSWVIHAGSEVSSAVPVPTLWPGESATTTSLVTHSVEDKTPISTTVPGFSQSASSSISPTATSIGVNISLSVPATKMSTGVPGVDANTATPMLTVFPGEAESTTSSVTHPETQASSAGPTLIVSSGERVTAISLATYSVETSTSLSSTAPRVPYGGSDTTPTMATSLGTQTSSAILTTISPGVIHGTTLLVTGLGSDTRTTFPTPSSSPYETTTSRITHPSETRPTATPTAPIFSHGLTTSMVSSSGTEANSGTPTMSISPEEPDRLTSQVLTTSEQPTSTPVPTMTLSTSQSESTNLSTTHPRTVSTSMKFPISSTFPPLSETTASLSITPSVRVSTVLPTLTGPPGGPETDTSVFTTETSRSDQGPTSTALLSTHPGSEASTALPSVTMSPGSSTTTGLLFTRSLAETSSGALTQAFSSHIPSITSEPTTITSRALETSSLVTTIRTSDFAKPTTSPMMTYTPPETSTLPTTSHGEGLSPSTTQKTATSETINSATRGSRPTVAQTTSTSVSPFVPLTTTTMAILTSEMVTSGTAMVPGPVPFTLNFTITNLGFEKNMEYPGSWKFNTTERVLQSLLKPLMKNSSLGALYSGCRLTSLRPDKDGAATSVNAICTYHPGPAGLGLDKEKLYWELSQLTNNITHLGPYTLDRDSLYVNGFTHRSSALTTSSPGTSTAHPGTSGTPSSIPSLLTTVPSLAPFTLNFTIMNLQYTADMKHRGSAKFNTTEAILQRMLGPVFTNTNIGPQYSGCQLSSLRPEKDGSATSIHMICTHHSKPTSTRLDRKRLYWELSHETKGITRLGAFILDRNSLYVNGYNYRWAMTSTPSTAMVSTIMPTSAAPALGSTAAGSKLAPFTLNFTITNLEYEEDMGHPGTGKFNVTERILQRLLRPLFKKTSAGALYSECRLDLLRPEKEGAATGVDAICTYHPKPTGPGLDKEQLYRELSQLTLGITQLGPYSLDPNSLYVNGYNLHSLASTPSTAGLTLVPFTLNFTITNLEYKEGLDQPGSWKFNATERILQRLLRPLFKKTSVGPLYSDCRLDLLRSEKEGVATGVDAICTYYPDPTGPGLDRERLYRELSQLTLSVTQLGPYSLDPNSLYVNGYNLHSLPSTPSMTSVSSAMPTPTSSPTGPILVPFTLNFTITNLEYKEDLSQPGSGRFNTTERILQRLLRRMFKKTSVGPLYSDCRLDLLRPEKEGAATGVDAICTYRPDPTGPALDRERLYRELSQLTLGTTHLGPYSLDPNSLYVNGEHRPSVLGSVKSYNLHSLPSTPSMTTVSSVVSTPSSSLTAAGPILVPFTLNFTITNLEYKEDLGQPGSGRFNATERILQRLLRTLFKKTSVGFLYSDCRLHLLRPEKKGAATGVDTICTYHHNITGPGLDREQLYKELSQLTHARLGPYSLDPNSLYVNGYNLHSLSSTPSTSMVVTVSPAIPALTSSPSAASPILVPFTLNFTITNLEYKEELGQPGSGKFNTTEKILQKLLRTLFQKTSIGPLYFDCTLDLLRPKDKGAGTGVDATCNHHPDPTGPGLDRERLYRELSQLTLSITQLGPYSLDPNSLYVNGYNLHSLSSTPSTSMVVTVSPAIPALTSSPSAAGPILVPFTLNFTITNLEYKENLGQPGSGRFNTTERILQKLLRTLFKKTSIGPLYSDCRLDLLRPKEQGAATGVDTSCTHRPDLTGPGLDRERLYRELSQLTLGVTHLGPYSLDQDSLYVDGYTHQTTVTTPNSEYPVTPDHHTPIDLTQCGFSFFSPAATTGPVLIPFTLNFTITNLGYREGMQEAGSGKFNTTERVLQGLLRPMFHNTSVGPLYSGCRLDLLRPKKDGSATAVDAVCTYRPDALGSTLDRERLYSELSQLTLGITQLGRFTLDPDSLYVDGYTHHTLATTPSFRPRGSCGHDFPSPTFFLSSTITASISTMVPVTINFTITNMHYMKEMGSPGSSKFNITERILQRLLNILLNKTSISTLCTGCSLASLRLAKDGAATGVDAICTFHPDPTGSGLDRERLYWELSHETHGVSRLGPYTLDQNSLYVNGFSLGAAAPTTTTGEISQELFTVNFTIANLRYSADMGRPGSVKFNITDALMEHLLSPLFRKSSLGPRYTGCRVTTLRSVKNGAQTQVDMVCAYQKAPGSLELPAKLVFRELSWYTHGIARLGPYSLDKDSLYLNGYNEPGPDEPPTTLEPATTILPSPSTSVQPESTTATSSSLTTFTLNFTITNLPFSEDLSSSSAMFNGTERILQHLLEPLLWNSSLGPVYSHCRLNSLRPEKDGEATSVHAICAYHHDPVGPGLDIQQLYWELSQMTHNVTQLGNYTLDQHSLHVNGYTQQVTIITSIEVPTGSPSSQNFHLNFTITNLPYSQNIAQPGTILHQQSKRSIEHALNGVFRNSSIKNYFSNCQVLAFRPVPHSNHTGVDSLCGFSPLTRRVDRVTIYEEFLRMTQNGTQLQNFTLDRNSVLVDGYSVVQTDLTPKNTGLPFWAIILICLTGLLSIISCLICCFLVTICRRKKEGDYQVQHHRLGYYLPHLDLRKLQ
ncbi:mucin-16-like [Thomomys bottae]